MQKNIKKIFGERLTKLIDAKYKKKIQFYKDFEQELDNKNITGKKGKPYNVVENGKKWVNGKTIPDNPEILVSLANFFNVSIDYLLGNSENPTDYSEQFIHKYTGLAHSSIRMLEKTKNNNFCIHPYLDFLLEFDDNINDKLDLIFRICNYILNSENISSYYENGVSKIRNKTIELCDEYGKAVTSIETKDMENAMIIAINDCLKKIRSNTNTNKERKLPSIYDILEEMMEDLQFIEDIRNDEHAICRAYQLTIHEQRFMEHIKRLKYLYDCESVDDIDFDEFKKRFHYKYDDEEIALLKKHIGL